MPHVLVAGKLHPSGLLLLKETKGITYDYVEDLLEEDYLPYISKAEGLVLRTQPLRKATILNAPRLQIVSRHGVGYDAVDLTALNEKKIPLTVVGDVNSQSVAEHTMMLLLATSKRLLRSDRACRGQGSWGYRNSLESQEVAGKHLLIIGYGRIGKKIAEMASAFDLKISVFDPFLQKPKILKNIVIEDNLLKAIKNADFISLHLPNSGTPILGATEIFAMKPSAIVINTARGGLIDDKALASALKENRVAAAGIDVFLEEPPALNHPYSEIDTAILSPHSAGLSRESAERMAIISVKNILDFFKGELDPALIINKDWC